MDVKPFSDIKVRQAMQQAIDLPTIAATYYGGTCPPYPSGMTSMYMTGWTLPYTQWPQVLKDQYAYDPTSAKKLLADAGYPSGFTTNVVASNGADLDLLQIVKSYFAAVGINMSITTMDPAAWSTFVRAHKHDQLCYGGNSAGFTFPPFSGFRRWLTGYAFSWANVSDPTWDAMRTQAIAATTSIADAQKIVVKANQYMAEQHWSISLLTPNFFALYQPWLKGYSGQVFSISAGGGIGPLYFGFYTSRFWIDTNLKKSMGR
jgi:peptide/nickel transport system substrate-binding protein